ncbi:MAG: acetyl-CoA C-acyltransferase, partial [Acidimicrobiales bacterium]
MGSTREVFVLDAVRTPIGRYRGALSSVRPDDLAAGVLSELLARRGEVDPGSIDDVFLGAANQSGEDNRNVARMASLLARLPVSVAGATVNRLCGSSLEAVLQGFRSIALGEADVVIAGGVESMSRAPFVMLKAEQAFPRSLDVADTTLGWRFVNPGMPPEWTVPMGETAEIVAERWGVSRSDQDAFALRSHRRAVAAMEGGHFDAEIAPVVLADGTKVSLDEGPRPDTSQERLAELRPAFRSGGTVTAGNSSPLNDGAAALMLASGPVVERLGARPLARILGGGSAGVSPEVMGIGPVPA